MKRAHGMAIGIMFSSSRYHGLGIKAARQRSDERERETNSVRSCEEEEERRGSMASAIP